MRNVVLSWVAVLALASASLLMAAEPKSPAPGDAKNLLWQIGKADNNTADLAFGPAGYSELGKLKQDPLYVVGYSDAKKDWPYVHPGPYDAWAGGGQHTFTIAFALKEKPRGGAFRLLVDLADTHGKSPPQLAILINGKQVTTHATPAGGTDASVFGDPSKGVEHRFEVPIPPAALKPGLNEIAMRTLSASWVLYDWLGLEAPAGTELQSASLGTMVHNIQSIPALVKKDGRLLQSIAMTVWHFDQPAEAEVRVTGAAPIKLALRAGAQTAEVAIPAVDQQRTVTVEVVVKGKTIATRELSLKPVRKWVVYLLPHSHVDIGYTKLQTEVERDHWRFYEQALEAIHRTGKYPPGAQFKWNVEVLWAVDSYLKQAPPEKQQQFIDAVKKGWIGLDALYGNELTALCRPEELVRLVDYAQRISRRCGVTIDSAMISDVPGYTWGLMSVLAASGVKYMSIGPNGGDRIGYTLEAWADKPFYWIAPDGRGKVLCWIPGKGYWRTFGAGPELFERLERMEESGYPYELVQDRYCLGDNAGPGVDLAETVKQWNEKYEYPKLIIATTSEMMRELERRYGDKLPQAKGDFTPYWEDGAASSARETGLNREAAERLSQAEALFAVLQPKRYPADAFYAAWRNVILYDEHTWGAHNSVTEPDSEFVRGQWTIKQAFALDADKQSRELLRASNAPLVVTDKKETAAWLVFNTCSWPRTDVAVASAPKETLATVRDAEGRLVPCQRVAGGVAFLAKDVPPFGAKRFTLEEGVPALTGSAKLEGATLSNAQFSLTLDKTTGTIRSLKSRGIPGELVDTSKGGGLNEYLYVPGKDPKDAKRSGPVELKLRERGPLVSWLEVEGPAPGCKKLERHVILVEGLDRIQIMDTLAKEKVRTKEGVHFAFPFLVPKGVMRMDIPFAVVRPEVDQLPGACKNWFTVQRWVDVSNDQYGITWATVQAPLVEVGAITAETPWIRTIEPSQTLYSYVMNNYWHTNYKADQEGPTVFEYALRPHVGPYDPVACARFGIEVSQPLVVVPAKDDAPAMIPSRLRVQPDEVIVTAFKPANDGKGLIVRLFNVGSHTASATLKWSDPAPKTVSLSNLAEEPASPVTGPLEIPASGFVTLRAELP